MKKTRIYKFVFFAIMIFAFFTQKMLFAGLTVDPIVYEVVAQKDVETMGSIKVLNTGDKPIHVTVSPEEWSEIVYNVSDWLKFGVTETELAPNEQKELKFTINLPKDSSGELRCMVFIVADEIGENKSNVGIRFGVPFYVVVGGTSKLDVEISDFKIEYTKDTVKGIVLVNNKSNIHIRPNVDVEIKNEKKEVVHNIIVPYGQPVQANQSRIFAFEDKKTLPSGKYIASVRADYGKLYAVDASLTKDSSFEVVSVVE